MTHAHTACDGFQPGPRLVAAVETVRTKRTRKTVFNHVKVIHILAGQARIETEDGSYLLSPGMVFTLGAGRWCSLDPCPSVRMWTLYLDEEFLQKHLRWVFASVDELRVPVEWNGGPIISQVGVDLIRRIEPVWRQMAC